MASFLQYSTLLLALSLPALASPLLEVRGRDNLARCFDPTGTAARDIASRAAATGFCSSLLSIPVVTVPIATTTPVSTVTTTVTTTDATEVQTSFTTSTSIITEQSISTTTVTARPYYKRDASVKLPNCATNYPLSALSSACGLISVEPSTLYVTATALTSTDVQTSIIHETTTTATTTTSIASTTTTESATATSTVPANCVSTFTVSNGRKFCLAPDYINIGGAPEFVRAGPMDNIAACAEKCATDYAGRCVSVEMGWQMLCVIFLSAPNEQYIPQNQFISAYLMPL